MSEYEMIQVDKFIADLYGIWGRNLDQEEVRSEAWITYMEIWKACNGEIYRYYDWGDIYVKLKETIDRLRRIQNEKIQLESRLSLNMTFGEDGPTVESWFPRRSGDFVNQIALWDYIRRLGELKTRILRLMYQKEEDYEIMCRVHLTLQEYYLIKMELRQDFKVYLEIGGGCQIG